MTKDVTLSLRIDRKLSNKLERHAKLCNRSKSSLVAIAIENFLDVDEKEIVKIKKALARVNSGAPTIPHEEVVRWIKSWGTSDELPPPKTKKTPR